MHFHIICQRLTIKFFIRGISPLFARRMPCGTSGDARRGKGLADERIKSFTKEAKSEKVLELCLYAHRDNERTINAYECCGFTDSPYLMMRAGL